MKYLVMCEGSNELEVVRILLAKRYICCGKKRYNNSSKFYHDYYSVKAAIHLLKKENVDEFHNNIKSLKGY